MCCTVTEATYKNVQSVLPSFSRLLGKKSPIATELGNVMHDIRSDGIDPAVYQYVVKQVIIEQCIDLQNCLYNKVSKQSKTKDILFKEYCSISLKYILPLIIGVMRSTQDPEQVSRCYVLIETMLKDISDKKNHLINELFYTADNVKQLF